MVYAEILAGGAGTRMGQTEMPKQFLMLGEKPVFIHTIEQFLINARIEKILVCCPREWMEYTEKTINEYFKQREQIVVVQGGNTRNETILNGCRFIEQEYGISENDIILTHDAVRPFVTQRIIDDNIDEALEYGAVDTVIEAFDTIVHSVNGQTISDIPIRSEMYQGQTPQTFKIKLLMEFLTSLSEEETSILTDACKALVLKGMDVRLIRGEVFNMKITTQYDLEVAGCWVKKL